VVLVVAGSGKGSQQALATLQPHHPAKATTAAQVSERPTIAVVVVVVQAQQAQVAQRLATAATERLTPLLAQVSPMQAAVVRGLVSTPLERAARAAVATAAWPMPIQASSLAPMVSVVVVVVVATATTTNQVPTAATAS
jgi:hypothetical protein